MSTDSATSHDITGLAERLNTLIREQADREWPGTDGTLGGELQIPPAATVTETFRLVAAALLQHPDGLIAAWADYRSGIKRILLNFSSLSAGEPAPLPETTRPGDPRFRHKAWSDDPIYSLLRDVYFFTGAWIEGLVRRIDGLDAETRRKALFFTRQFVAAIAPCNFFSTNPLAQQKAVATAGQSFVAGLENLVSDLGAKPPQPAAEAAAAGASDVGSKVAATAGKVVFQNELMQLIQYAPTTGSVWRRPLLIVPPWINKFYVLDLGPERSLVRWLVDRGVTVFVISWINPDARHADKTFDDYLLMGPVAAASAIERQTGVSQINTMGYCLGGTLTAAYLAWLAHAGEKDKVTSATLLTTMLDFADAGDLGVFIDEPQLLALERHMSRLGYLEGREMQRVFSMLRPEELVWQQCIERYLLGRSSRPSDILNWSSDGTRMPHMMHSFYLRKLYLENRLIVPGGIELAGRPIDLGRITSPSYVLGARHDHIAPWCSVYAGLRKLGGKRRFVLADSGHVAGIVNPPSAARYRYWTNHVRAKSGASWFGTAQARPGSWWPDWLAWLMQFQGGTVPARSPSDGKLRPLEDAPGSYVRNSVAAAKEKHFQME